MQSLPLHVLNPQGRDPDQDFAAGPGSPGGPNHPPVNYHAYAACTGGAFLRSLPRAVASARPVILLARGDLKTTVAALRALRAADAVRPVWLAVKEAGRHQVAALLADAARLNRFRSLLEEADGFLASSPWLQPLASRLGARRAAFIPTPYPVDVPAWCPTRIPWEARDGILIGTREFDVPSRNHAEALAAALEIGRSLGAPVAVVSTRGRREQRLLRAFCDDSTRLRILPGPLAYPAWLETVSRHRIVFQLDRSSVPGQVAGDALLAGTPCVGGDGAIEQIAFPGLHGAGRDTSELIGIAGGLLSDSSVWQRSVRETAALALRELSFAAGAVRLRDRMG